jgi:ATP synthase protein I
MDDGPTDPGGGGGKKPFNEIVNQRAQRKIRAHKQRKHSVWFGLGMFGLVGWSVAIPTLIGVTIGLWMDSRWPGRPSWTLTLLIIGVAVGCLNAWYWIKQESQRE